MNWSESIKVAIDYIENNLTNDIETKINQQTTKINTEIILRTRNKNENSIKK